MARRPGGCYSGPGGTRAARGSDGKSVSGAWTILLERVARPRSGPGATPQPSSLRHESRLSNRGARSGPSDAPISLPGREIGASDGPDYGAVRSRFPAVDQWVEATSLPSLT